VRSLKAELILGIEGFRFVEPTFADLSDDLWTDILIAALGDQGRLLVDEKDDPIALAIGDGYRWNVGSFLARKPNAALIERFEETAGEIWQEKREVWAEAVREYYSIEVINTVGPALEDQNPSRQEMVNDLLAYIWGKEETGVCLDCCCGSGIGAVALRKLGFAPLSYDNDASLLSLGFAKKRLVPEQTMLIDAAVASQYTGTAPHGLGLMFGEINNFTQATWEQITAELIALTASTIITVGTEKEAKIVEEWVKSRGRSARVFENKRDPIYDHWVLDIRRKK
jgi:hypothetical protein